MNLEGFSVWICEETLDFSDEKPCYFPDNCFHLIVGSNLSKLEAVYYGVSEISVTYDQDELNIINFLTGQGDLITKINAFIQGMSQGDKDYLNEIYPLCFDNPLPYIFILQVSVLLIFTALLRSPLFSPPLPVIFPDIPLSQKLLKLFSAYFVYLTSVRISPEIQAIIDIINDLNIWKDLLQKGPDVDFEVFNAKLNLEFIKYAYGRGESSSSYSLTTPQESSYSLTTPQESSYSLTTPQESSYSVSTPSGTSLTTTYSVTSPSPSITPPTYSSSTSISSPVADTYHEIITPALKEIRRKFEGCIEESIRGAYPRIDNYIKTHFQEQGRTLLILKDHIESEIERTKELYQNIFSALEKSSIYEERIRYLENEIKLLKRNDLQMKVEHLQSTVTQLLKRK